MSKIKIGINGFGRIGKLIFNIASSTKDIEVVAINDIIQPDYLIYMLKYDSIHGKYNKNIELKSNNLIIDKKNIRISSEKNPIKLKWDEVDAEYIIDSTGIFLSREECLLHLKAGAKKVIISAPPKDDIPMFVMGVNHKSLKKDQNIVSTASCTTNCLAPLAMVINNYFGIVNGLMTTIHSITATQKVVDGISERDWRGGRSALVNIIPSSTGAAKSVGKVIPELNGKLTGISFRVPTINVSVVDLTVSLKKSTTYNEIKNIIKSESQKKLKNILGYTEDPVVSTDFLRDIRTSIFDANASIMLNPNFVKLISWYDNEFAYSYKVVDFVRYMSLL